MTQHSWNLPGHTIQIGRRPLVMGIVNCTPDSFSDGGLFFSTDAAVAHGLELARQGADLLDVGGESTRPGSTPVALHDELQRVIPVIESLTKLTNVPLSIDTSKAEVARASFAAGASIINDVTALTGDPQMPEIARTSGAGLILMHMQGTPATMQIAPHYDDVVGELGQYFEARLQFTDQLGIARERVALDPGIGFGKKVVHNLEILARLGELQRFGRPVCLGVSRKGLLGKLLDRPVHERLAGSLAAACYAMSRNAVQILRVHDVAATRDAVVLIEAIEERLPDIS